MAKIIVLLSGGLDSATALGKAVSLYGSDNVCAVSVNYGQKHSKELRCATQLALHYNVPHYTIEIADTFKFSNCPLLQNSTEKIPEGDYANQIGRADNGKVATYVPFRNGLLLANVAALAGSIYPDEHVSIWIGAHADDAAGNAYADCSVTFIEKMNAAISEGSYGLVEVYAPFVNCNKAEIVRTGLELCVPYELTWSCYNGGEAPCGKCGTCIDRAKAFEANNAIDPAIDYKEE